MPRPMRGSVTTHQGRDGLTYRSLRFTAYAKRRRVPLGPVSEAAAEEALRHTLADVERGVWQPSAVIEAPPEPTAVPTFHEFAEEWWTLRARQLAPKTQADYMWRLTVHLIPWFGEMPLDAITFEEVERYIAAELAEGERIREAAADGKPIIEVIIDKHGCERKRKARPLSPRSINMTVTLLGAILERARKRKLIDGSPAKDKDLRVKEREPARSYLDTAAQIEALLDAAGELDREATKERRHIERRAALATLTFAGLRINELCALRWRDVDLAAGWLHTGSKTDAGRYRAVKIRGALRNELVALRARCGSIEQDAYVFATRTGKPMSDGNLRRRTLGRPEVAADGEAGKGAIGRANANLAKRGLPPLPEHITPHSLRRTFCSLLYALGEPPTIVMEEMGHTDPGLALRVYAQAMRRGKGEKAQLRALVEGEVMANGGQREEIEGATHSTRRAA